MARRKIALIGNSGAGKTDIVKRLGGNLQLADMDNGLSRASPPAGEEVLDWVLDGTGEEPVLAIAVHMQTLEELRDAKKSGRCLDRLGQVLFVYLYNPDPGKHRMFLERPKACGGQRDEQHIKGVLGNQPRVHAACKELADVTLNTATLSIEEAAWLIGGLRDAVVSDNDR
jgi:hypothetical protein